MKSVKKVTGTLSTQNNRAKQPENNPPPGAQGESGVRAQLCCTVLDLLKQIQSTLKMSILQVSSSSYEGKSDNWSEPGHALNLLKLQCLEVFVLFWGFFPSVNSTNPVTIPCSSTSTLNCSIPLTRIHQSHTVLEEINRPQPICHQ